MAIVDGQTASANDVMKMTGTMFKNQAQLLFNAKHIGFDAQLNVATGAPNLKNIEYSANADDADTKY